MKKFMLILTIALPLAMSATNMRYTIINDDATSHQVVVKDAAGKITSFLIGPKDHVSTDPIIAISVDGKGQSEPLQGSYGVIINKGVPEIIIAD